LLGDTAESFLAPAGVLFGHEPNPGRKVAGGAKGFRVSNTRHKRGGQRRSDAGYGIETTARLI
jgi:hypothetical protein